jgi:hypothetical protein
LLVSSQTTGTAITLVDNAGLAVNFFTNTISLTATLTVSASANTLVVVVASRNGDAAPKRFMTVHVTSP